MKRGSLRLAWFAVVALALACNDLPYPNKTQVTSVRILAVRADLPYAHPGETVNLEALVVDGRWAPGPPMRMLWFPTPCINPPGGLYYHCYPLLEAAFPDLHVDVTDKLAEGNTRQVKIPADALAGFVQTPGRSTEPIVTSFTFMIACAGHVERKLRTTNLGENQAPFGCFGPDGNELPIEEGVFGFTRVSVTETRRNALPKITGLVFRGQPVDLATGLALPRCTKDAVETFTRGNCDTYGMDIAFDESDAEIDPENLDANGRPGHETLYVDWYVSIGRFTENRRVLRDPFAGGPAVSNILYEPARHQGSGTIWAVFHDNRGGTDWTSAPITIGPKAP